MRPDLIFMIRDTYNKFEPEPTHKPTHKTH